MKNLKYHFLKRSTNMVILMHSVNAKKKYNKRITITYLLNHSCHKIKYKTKYANPLLRSADNRSSFKYNTCIILYIAQAKVFSV